MTCSHCDHFLADGIALAEGYPRKVTERLSATGQGICRRYPPRYVAHPGHAEPVSLFPYVNAAHVCGEFLSGSPLC